MVSALRQLLPFIQPYRRPVVMGLGCALASTASTLLTPWVLKLAVDDLQAGVTRQKLLTHAAALVGIALVAGVFRFLMRRLVIGASRGIEYDLRNAFFARLQRFPAAYYQAHRTGDLMSRATNDLNAVRTMIGPAVMYSTTTVLLFVVAVGLMLSLNVKLTLISLLPLPLVSLTVKFFGSAIHRRFERIQAQLSELSAIVQETLAGVRVVRAYGQERTELDRFRRANDEYVVRNRALIRLQGLFYPSMTFFLGLGALLVLWLGSREVVLGRLSIGELVAFNAYLAMLSWPMIAFGWVTNMLQRGLASWERILSVLNEPEGARTAPAASAGLRLPAIEGRLEFRHLTFAYNGRPVLEDISFSVEPGRTVAIIGPTGSGKSTLLSLVPRLFDPPPGTVLVDGTDVLDLPLAALRARIGFVAQEPFLFSDTLAGNIAFGLPALDPAEDRDARDDRVRHAASIARIDKDVAEFPRGYDTLVGERGITLSGGQKQRTALARALALDPSILILDDALSAVDTYTEEEILTGLRGVMRQRTALIVSHRVSTVQDADAILVLDRGRIVERGTHAELIELGGAYARLAAKQRLEEELAAS